MERRRNWRGWERNEEDKGNKRKRLEINESKVTWEKVEEQRKKQNQIRKVAVLSPSVQIEETGQTG